MPPYCARLDPASLLDRLEQADAEIFDLVDIGTKFEWEGAGFERTAAR